MTRCRDLECHVQDRFDDHALGKGWHMGALFSGSGLYFVFLMMFTLVILGCSVPSSQPGLIVTPEPTVAVADELPVDEATTSPTAPVPSPPSRSPRWSPWRRAGS